ncbi:uncharacterized protein LOC130817676 [Amaranthus tricolor]|uniref:uncharacterized protein LOC130817676 n=1 Tax=Amaranthus tricolor TaxID=29722 RepID=UPI002590BA87|nr:uncharacterized protein LOC130817676 [Amaranthus tricolor]
MKNRGKRGVELEPYINNGDYENFPEFPCRKHPPSSSSGGICAYCLNDRLSQLICPDCGEQRISSSCSCSDVGRISLLLENVPKMDPRSAESGKFWKIGKLFGKKREKPNRKTLNPNQINAETRDFNRISRSRSVCSFRRFHTTEDNKNGDFPNSSSAARVSSVSTGNFIIDSAKRSCFSESEARISNFEFVNSDDQAYIDLKLHDISSSSSDYSRVPVPDLAAMRRSGFGLSTKDFEFRGDVNFEMFNNGGRSCRISSVGDGDLRKCRRSSKVWKWFFRHQQNHQTGSDKFDYHDFNL